jgi:hypothetical protein
MPWRTANAYQVMWSWMRVIRPLLRATRRLQLTGTTALRRTKGWGAVLVALVSGLVLRSLCYTVTASRSAVTAAV